MKYRSDPAIGYLLLSFLTCAAPSYAAAETGPDQPVADDAAGTPAVQMLEQIVVTARKRQENLQDVPVTVNALSTATLEAAHATNVEALADMVSDFHVYDGYQPNTPGFEMRGQYEEDSSPALDPSVGVYFDDVYIARSAGTLLDFQDMSRVEVLKGPQGTLYGANSTGGAIKLVSNKPVDEFEANVSTAYEFEARRMIEQGMINVPLTDTLAVRAVGTYTKTNQGYFTYFTQDDPTASFPLDTGHDAGGRVELGWRPSDTFNALLEADFTDIGGMNQASTIGAYYPNSAASAGFGYLSVSAIEAGVELNPANLTALFAGNPIPALNAGTAFLNSAVAQYYANPYRGGNNSEFLGYSTPTNTEKFYGDSAHLEWDFDGMALKSITAVRGIKMFSTYDVDGTSLGILPGFEAQHENQESQEFTLDGNVGKRADWTLGAFYLREFDYFEDFTRAVADLGDSGGSAGSATIADLLSQSGALYGQGDYNLTSKWTLTAGARVTRDWRSSTPRAQQFYTSGAPSTCAVEVNGVANCDYTKSLQFNNVSYTAGLSYHLTDDKMLYFTTADAFRAGGINPRINTAASFTTFRPEKATNYEVGLKADWLDHRLRTNYAFFYTDYKDIQTTLTEPGVLLGNTVSVVLTVNAPSAKIYGLEQEITVRPIDPLLMGVNGGYLYSTYSPGGVLSLQGLTTIPTTPKLTGSAFASWTEAVNSRIDATLRIDEYYESSAQEQLSLLDHDPNSATYNQVIYRPTYHPYGLTDANLTLTDSRSRIQVSLYGKNLTNKFYLARTEGADGLGVFNATTGAPREYGIRIQDSFGGQ